MTGSCPPSQFLKEYLSGSLSRSEEGVLESHVEQCPACQEWLDRYSADEPLTEILQPGRGQTTLPPDKRQQLSESWRSTVALASTWRNGTGEEANGIPAIPGYRLLGELGRGALGVVYRATSESLLREVAIKILRAQADPTEQARFRREAQALAQLHHPNIVQIFEAGESGDRPFLVLEYVAGGSLASVAAGRVFPPRDAAQLVATLAEAVEAAHRRGMVHRDIKPGNILLDRNGSGKPADAVLTNAIPKITDFGVVKYVGDCDDLTQTRDFLGTPNYMSPEQSGDSHTRVGPACDIWALGAILYELTTGRSPFTGASAVDTMMQIRFEEPVAPRRLHPEIPRDLETICLRCLEKSPVSRYSSAQALADDLHRYLDGKPIAARPVGAAGKCWRWCRRNPALAVVTATAAGLLCTLAIGGPLVAYQQSLLRQAAETQRLRADGNLSLASHALEATLDEIQAQVRRRPDSLSGVDRRAWRAAIPFLEKITQQEATNIDQMTQRARAKHLLARTLGESGEIDRAEPMFLESLNELQRLVDTAPERRANRHELALCHQGLGRFYYNAKRSPYNIEPNLTSAIELQDRLCKDGPDNAQYREELGESLFLLTNWLEQQSDRLSDAKKYALQGVAVRSGLTVEFPQTSRYLVDESVMRLRCAIILEKSHELSLAMIQLHAALENEEKLSNRNAADPEDQLRLAALQSYAGRLLYYTAPWEEAVAMKNKSAATIDRLADTFPSAILYVRTAAKFHEAYAATCIDKKEWGLAEAQQIVANRYWDHLVEIDSQRDAIGGRVAGHKLLAEILNTQKRPVEARAQFRAAIGIGEKKFDPIMPDNDPVRLPLAEARIGLGELIVADDPLHALEQFDSALAALPPAPQTKVITLTRAHAGRRQALVALGRLDEARADEEASKKLIERK